MDLRRAIVWLALLLAALPWMPAGGALVLGMLLGLGLGNPWPSATRVWSKRMLTWSVVGLGANMNLLVVAQAGARGFGVAAALAACTYLFGTWLGRRLGLTRDAALLVTTGTAICGGSAIAAVSPAIGASERDVSVALVTVFLLNAVGLLIFPPIGHRAGMDQESFGLWCALAVHDTSSVVGAASQFGERALEIATAAKLARALWIVPITLVVVLRRRRSGEASQQKPQWPWFILGFLLVATLVTFVPALQVAGHVLAKIAQRLLVVTLTLIGLGLTREALRAVGIKPLLHGTLLWIVMASATFAAIRAGWIT